MNPSRQKSPVPPDVRAWMDALPPPEGAALDEVWQLSGEALGPAVAPNPARKAAVWAALQAALDVPDERPAGPLDAPAEVALPASPRVRPAPVDRQPAPGHAPQRRAVGRTAVRWLSAAAVVVALVGFGYRYWTQPITVQAPNGETRLAVLPDGSQVQLNSGSSLTYPRHFTGARRGVTLEGEAFFEVVKDAGHPFVVSTFNARTTVLGTSFNVRARQDDVHPATSVIVATGRVRLAPTATAAAGVVLDPGRTSTLAADADRPTAPGDVLLDRALAWRTGGFAFRNEPLGVVFAEIERRFAVSIEASGAILARPSSYYKHEPQDAEELLQELTQATGLRYRETANGFEVYAP